MTVPQDAAPVFPLRPLHQRLMDEATQSMAWNDGDLLAWQGKLRRHLRKVLGMHHFPGKSLPLNVRSLWQQEGRLGSIEKFVYTAEEGSEVPAYICLPKKTKGLLPWVICLQGHTTGMHVSIGREREDEFKRYRTPGDRDFGLQAMKHGMAALCIEQRPLGYRRGVLAESGNSRNCHEPSMHALMLGRTISGERVWDVARGIQYLQTRHDVDRSLIGCMGNSSGGTTTMYAAALLPEITFAVPSCSFCTYRASILNVFHCNCNYVPGLYHLAEMADVFGLFAPRPLVIVNGIKDDIFPIEDARREFKRLRRIYAAAGARQNLKLIEGAGGHRFYAKESWPVLLELLSKQ